MSDPGTVTPPHRDPDAWPALIGSLGVENILVLIASWMKPRLRQEMSAEDLWQDTLYMAWRDRESHEWQDAYTYRQWLLGIARNRMRDAVTMMTTQKRGGGKSLHPLSTLASADWKKLPALPMSSTTPSRVAQGRERLDAMEQELRALPDELRDAVRLRVFEQLPMARVAEQLGVTLAIAKKRVYLGSSLYRTRLTDRWRIPAVGEKRP